jgi:hypothetical protein
MQQASDDCWAHPALTNLGALALIRRTREEEEGEEAVIWGTEL